MEEKKNQELKQEQLEQVAGGGAGACMHEGGIPEYISAFKFKDMYGIEHEFQYGLCNICHDKVYKRDGKVISEKQYNEAWEASKYQ